MMKVAKAKGTIEAERKKTERCQLLISEDAFLGPIEAKERPILLDIIEDRHERKATVISSQLPVANRYDDIGDPTAADAVPDRIVLSSHRIELTGESIRKMNAKKEQGKIKMTPSVRTLQGSKIKCFKGAASLCHRGANLRGFSI